MTNVEFGCCICTEQIDPQEGISIWIFPMGTEGTEEDVGQGYWAHGRCLAIAMHEDYASEIRDELKEYIKE